ncbi:PD-(D/E)XK nuclease family protein [Pseudomonas mohnii]|uniref:PDDEXK-like family protein n=1 Tax=Pseudomonas mohnii TaxID=395600 RepID=UPI0018C73D3C|nr:PD-(D/E)XK nuclease family protein [Pseudomonas mohnii]MBH8610257.1 PD-(D/E)XK nuclease family protein [Pseudomonas mohnii]
MQNLQNTQSLLERAGYLVKESQANLAATGETFNIFAITKIERAEVATHSAMIAELLNPRGSHGKGPVFLAHFLSTIELEHESSLDNAQVRKEQTFGGGRGRVDIVIHLRSHLILIENKIDAEDGNWQLKQYADIGMASGKNWNLLYLTKKGTDAHERSHQGVDYQRISYREHILEWLDLCLESCTDTPALHHVLIQYRNLVRKISGMTMTQKARNTLIELLCSDDQSFKSADAIAEALPYAKGAVLFRFFQAIQSEIASVHPRAPSPTGFPGLEFNEENCSKWFMAGRLKVKHVGLFFNVGVENMLFRVEVASDALHYGFVPVTSGGLGSIEQQAESMQELPHIFPRHWKAFQWHSHLYRDNVANNMQCLLDPSHIVPQILQTIQNAQGFQPSSQDAETANDLSLVPSLA